MQSMWKIAVPIIFLAGMAWLGFHLYDVQKQAAECGLDECPLELRIGDDGHSFTYSVTTRFTVVLDAEKYPKEQLRCAPEGIIGEISNAPAVEPPLYAARFESVAPGECSLTSGDWKVTIRVH